MGTVTAQDLLRRLDDLGVDLTLADDRIRYRGRGEALPAELLTEMKRHRDELVELLSRRASLAWPPGRDGGSAGGSDGAVHTGPLTAAQRSLWATTYFAEDGTYNLCGALRLRGSLDHDAFTAALRDIHRRHPSLRTVLPVDRGEPRQRVLPGVEPPLTVVDVTAAADPYADCLAECARLADRPLALDTAPPVAMRLFRLAADDHVFFFVLHHVIADGPSFGPLLDDLAHSYGACRTGEDVAPAGTALDMVDYARWEADRLAYADLAPARKYWRDRLDDAALGALPLPPPLDGAQDGGRAGAHRVTVTAATTAAVRELADATRSSVFTVVSTAVAVALSRYTGRDDLVVGMPVSRRDRPGLERMVGLLLDMAPVRLDVTATTPFAELVKRTRAAVLGAVRHAPVPREVAGDPASRALFNVILTDLGAELPAPTFAGLRTEHVEVPQVGAKYDLNFLVRDDGDTLTIDVEADRRAVADADVAAIAATAVAILDAAADTAAAGVAAALA
ncbi:condensation domain-containing protein, partial [Actinophytocola sp.]|uniref:condensation domain-containing protein n=1 Tax=Actinophytocola sp. TaxID=1872138 RepID=UPI003D6ACBC0